MGKGPFEFDAEKLEFRRRDRNTPWTDAGAEPAELVPEPAATPPAPPGGPDATPGEPARVEKPEGYVDPTPTRRRRRRKKTGSERAAENKSTVWRGMMWGLILIMALFWVYMLYTHGSSRREPPAEDKFFIFDRDRVAPAP